MEFFKLLRKYGVYDSFTSTTSRRCFGEHLYINNILGSSFYGFYNFGLGYALTATNNHINSTTVVEKICELSKNA